MVLAIHPSIAARNLKEFADAARADRELVGIGIELARARSLAPSPVPRDRFADISRRTSWE